MKVAILERERMVGDIDTTWVTELEGVFASKESAKAYAQSEWVKENANRAFDVLTWRPRDDADYEETTLEIDEYNDKLGNFVLSEVEVKP